MNFYIFFFRISPKEAAMQYTIHCDYRNSVTKANGEKYGMYPMLIQRKYRIDEKRPMNKDGEEVKEKKPWSKFFKIQKLFYHCPRNKLYSVLDFPKCNESGLAKFKPRLAKFKPEHQNELQKGLDFTEQKIKNLELQIKKLLKENVKTIEINF